MAGTNTLTKLAPVLYSAAQEVSNEPFGVVDSIYTQFDNKGVAKGDKVKVPVAPTRAGDDFTPSNATPTGAGATADAVEVEITKSRKVNWNLTGEQQRSLENGGTDQEWIRQLLMQGMRTLRNEAEADAVRAVHLGASRAVGTAGVTPFASDLSGLVAARKILRDNGAPMADLQFVCDTAAEVNLLNLGIIQQAYAAGSDEERRQGRIARQFGFRIGQSAGISEFDAGEYNTGQTATVAKGGVDLATVTFGENDLIPGDIIQVADVPGAYVLGATDHTANTLSINRPGFLDAKTTGALTSFSDFTPNLAFERNAVVGIMRPPIIPANPTINQMVISDGMGMSYLLLDIAQYGQRTWEIHLAWGFKAVQPEHIAILAG